MVVFKFQMLSGSWWNSNFVTYQTSICYVKALTKMNIIFTAVPDEHILHSLVDAYVLMAVLDEHNQGFFSPVRRACNTFLRVILSCCILQGYHKVCMYIHLIICCPSNVLEALKCPVASELDCLFEQPCIFSIEKAILDFCVPREVGLYIMI